ncbi:hypothetical protein AAEO57_08005 [Flavobacterium sp. DGU38]|uniref:Uncharacterized protein n=1 Tax=Flavobacterium calami TaxID=3139144 RepID=A0ABU9IMP6_9FLAO
MKKILTLFAVVGLFAFSGCSDDDNDNVDYDTIPYAFEIKNVDLGRVTDNEYNLKSTFNFEINDNLRDDETVLIYRLMDLINSNTPVWQLIPRSVYFDNGNVIDYYYDFSKVDFVITARASFNLINASDFINDQTFRVVLIPSDLAASVNKNNYLEVMKAAKLDESQVQNVKF